MNLKTALRAGIALYFWLLLLEGVLRKWVFPQWSDVIFVIRDPVVIGIYLMATAAGIFPRRPSIIVVWIMVVLSLGFSLAGETPFLVTLFGLRTNYLHLPLIFIMAEVMNLEDVIRVGRWFMWGAVPILALMVWQFNSEPDALVNVGVGGIEGAQLRGAMGKIRPPGPFSFVSGVVSYFTLAAAFAFYFWSHPEGCPRWLRVLGSAAVIAAVPISISRSLLSGTIIVTVLGAVAALRDPRLLPRFIGPVAVGCVLLLVAADTAYIEAFVTRWDEALVSGRGGFYSNVIMRILGDFMQPFVLAVDVPALGHGIGLGTIAGARLSMGRSLFLLSEGELGRIILELGPFLGFVFIGWRAWLAESLLRKGWQKYVVQGDSLAWLVAAATFMSILNGQWGPATQLGFAIFGAGLSLAALNDPLATEDHAAHRDAATLEAPPE